MKLKLLELHAKDGCVIGIIANNITSLVKTVNDKGEHTGTLINLIGHAQEDVTESMDEIRSMIGE